MKTLALDHFGQVPYQQSHTLTGILTMQDYATFRFPSTYAGLQDYLDRNVRDARFLSVLIASGKEHGAYYEFTHKSPQGFRLARQANLIKGMPSDFPLEAGYEPGNKNHIPVHDDKGTIRGYISLEYADLTQPYARGVDGYHPRIVNHYLTSPIEMESAKLDLAKWLVSQYARELITGQAINRSASDVVTFLNELAERFERTQTVGDIVRAEFLLPDDNYQHGRGVRTLVLEGCKALNAVAGEGSEAKPFTPQLLNILDPLLRLHDCGKGQIRIRLNQFWLADYVHPADADIPLAAINSEKQRYWPHPNYIHPLLGRIMLSAVALFANAIALHHQSDVRDYFKDQREQWKKFGLLEVGLTSADEVTFFNRFCRVADLADAMTNNARLLPAIMLSQLNAKTKEFNELGLPSADPDILCFMIERGVFDRYLEQKILSPRVAGQPETQPVMDDAYRAQKEAILREHGYDAKKARVEARLLAAVKGEPFVAEHHGWPVAAVRGLRDGGRPTQTFEAR